MRHNAQAFAVKFSILDFLAIFYIHSLALNWMENFALLKYDYIIIIRLRYYYLVC